MSCQQLALRETPVFVVIYGLEWIYTDDMSQQQELMLIFSAAGIVMEDILGQHRVMQRISPRVIIIEPANAAAKEELQNQKNIKAVLDPGETVSAEIRKTLTPNETLFVDAYGRRKPQKKRSGDGLSWDAPGFAPPDSPVKRP